jgi:hypothetical protein
MPQSKMMSPLVEACITNDTTEIRRILQENSHTTLANEIFFGDQSILGTGHLIGAPPLWIASFYGHKEAVETLLEFGARPFVTGPYDESTLSVAARKGHVEIIKKILPAIERHPVDSYKKSHCQKAFSTKPHYFSLLAETTGVDSLCRIFAEDISSSLAERRASEERRRLEEAERARRVAEEAERARRVAEETERARRVAEETERARRVAEETERARRVAEETERARRVAEETERARIEEESRLRRNPSPKSSADHNWRRRQVERIINNPGSRPSPYVPVFIPKPPSNLSHK